MTSKFPIVLLFVGIAIAAGLYAFTRTHPEYDFTALLVADVILLILSLFAWTMRRKSVDARPQAFVRGVYGATMLKLFVCLAGILAYTLIKRPHVHKPTLFVMFGIYAIYSIIETTVLSKTARSMQ